MYLPEALEAGAEVVVSGDRAHYLLTVLRLRAGDPLTVFDGRGGEYRAKLLAAGRHQARLKIGAFQAREAESPLRIHLGLAIAKGEQMDWSVQKATELGVESIAPLLTERCNVRLQGKEVHKRAHWQKIAIAACEQCGRNRVPDVFLPQPLETWLQAQTRGVLLDPGGLPFATLAPPTEGLILLIGPEGGWCPAERELARAFGFVRASLGPRILRVETAVVAALSVAQALWGDLA
ncbi:16S rRNA (uracil(1498)-N(3))-methyltransferase [Methylothermus subterraneus]